MITVAILINGQPIVAKNAVNQGVRNKHGATKYINDAGEVLWHHRNAGAVELSIQLLRSIKNDEAMTDWRWVRKDAPTLHELAQAVIAAQDCVDLMGEQHNTELRQLESERDAAISKMREFLREQDETNFNRVSEVPETVPSSGE